MKVSSPMVNLPTQNPFPTLSRPGVVSPQATPPMSAGSNHSSGDYFSFNPTSSATLPASPPLTPQITPTADPKSDPAIINQALNLLGGIQHIPQEEAYIRQLGLSPCFHNGQEALRMIRNNNIQVVFGDMGDSPAHAQWVADQRTIMINQKYRGDNSPTTLYAISEAMYHEAGHAANVVTDPVTGQHHNLSILGNGPTSIGDDESSLQEELDCMALNSLAHGYHEAIDPAYAKAASSSRLLHDGVQLYYRYLLHDTDPYKNAIINRMVEKYGELPLSSPGHEPPKPMEPFAPLALSYRIAQRIQQQAPCPISIANSSPSNVCGPNNALPTPSNTPKLAYLA